MAELFQGTGLHASAEGLLCPHTIPPQALCTSAPLVWHAPNSSRPKLGGTWWPRVLSFVVGSPCWCLTPEGPRCWHPPFHTFLPFRIPCPQGLLLSNAFFQGLLFAGAKWIIKIKGSINEVGWALCEIFSPNTFALGRHLTALHQMSNSCREHEFLK